MSSKIKTIGYVLFCMWVVALAGMLFVTSVKTPLWIFATVSIMGMIPYVMIYSSDKGTSETMGKIRADKKGLLLEVTLIIWLAIVGFAFASAASERGITITHYRNTMYFE